MEDAKEVAVRSVNLVCLLVAVVAVLLDVML